MKIIRAFVAGVCLGLSACGGGSGSGSAIEGTWRGDIIHTGASCADGTFIGAGAGIVVGAAKLRVDGSDRVGSLVSASDGDCHFQGVRTDEGFTAEVVSGCEAALVSIRFRLDTADEAIISYNYDLAQVAVDPGEIACVAGRVAYVSR